MADGFGIFTLTLFHCIWLATAKAIIKHTVNTRAPISQWYQLIFVLKLSPLQNMAQNVSSANSFAYQNKAINWSSPRLLRKMFKITPIHNVEWMWRSQSITMCWLLEDSTRFFFIIAEFVMFGMIWPMYSRCCFFVVFFLRIIIINSPIDNTVCSTWDLQLAGFFFSFTLPFLKVQKITFANWTTKMNYHLELTSGSFEKPSDAQEVNLRSLHSHLV